MKNIEIKARIRDVASATQTADDLCGCGPAAVLHQVDTYFSVPSGRLKMREFGDDGPPGELIYYQRPDVPGPRASEYLIAPVSDPDELKAVLGAALGVAVIVRKTRTLYLHGHTRIHLDEVDGLGTFIEFEYVMPGSGCDEDGEREVRELMAGFGVGDADLERRSYSDLLLT
jgi:predicted adenylyl cyclase CyaB